MSDEKGPDAKVLCVPSRDARYEHYKNLNDAPDFLLTEIANFFEIYKLIEPGKESSIGEWADVKAAEAEIEAAIKRYPH
jgi:inorganic pyrophosphatase